MKKLLLALGITFLAGCSVLSSSEFDAVEYNGFIDIMTMAEQTQPGCEANDPATIYRAATIMESRAHQLENYTLHRLNNNNTVEIVDTIRETIGEFKDRYAAGVASKIYCDTKLEVIIQQAKLGADAVQQKVRR